MLYVYEHVSLRFLPAIRRRTLKIRPNIFLVSSLLLTLGLLGLLPSSIQCARYTGTDITRYMTQTAGLASLTIIVVGLIVIWTWLVRGSRVAWVIMTVIVWVWFPIMILPVRVKSIFTLPLSDWSGLVLEAWHGAYLAQVLLVNTVLFLLMLVGLILPVKALLRSGKPERDTQIYRDARQSPD
jgi:hypothetical protein